MNWREKYRKYEINTTEKTRDNPSLAFLIHHDLVVLFLLLVDYKPVYVVDA